MLVCPKCGRKCTDVPFIETFCADCYPIRLEVPREVEVQTCRDCNRMKLGMHWEMPVRKKIAEYVLRKCRGSFQDASYDETTGEAGFFLERGGKVLTFKRNIPLIRKKMLCPDCSRRRGGYYEAIIQLRGDQQRIAKFASWARQAVERKSFVAKIDEHRDGIDVYVGSFQAAMEFVQSLRVRYTLTKKLVGKRAGKRIYRSTFAVRLL